LRIDGVLEFSGIDGDHHLTFSHNVADIDGDVGDGPLHLGADHAFVQSEKRTNGFDAAASDFLLDRHAMNREGRTALGPLAGRSVAGTARDGEGAGQDEKRAEDRTCYGFNLTLGH
jgi:hypothetical protein